MEKIYNSEETMQHVYLVEISVSGQNDLVSLVIADDIAHAAYKAKKMLKEIMQEKMNNLRGREVIPFTGIKSVKSFPVWQIF